MRRAAVAIVACLLLGNTLSAAAADTAVSVRSAATGIAAAEPVWAAKEVVTIINRGSELLPDVVTRAIIATQASYGTWALSRGANVSMHSVRRGATIVQQAAAEFNYAMSTTAMPVSAAAQLMGRGLAGVLSSGFVIMGRTTAGLRGAQVGDIVDMVSAAGPIVPFLIGAIVDDGVIGGTEILMSNEQAATIGVTIDTRIILWGFRSRDLIDQQLAQQGLFARGDVRIRHSWDPVDPDSSMSTASVKALLGEFTYRLEPNGVDVALNTAWVNANMAPTRELLIEAIPIRARCNLAIRADLRAALTEVAAAGLAGAIDVDNTNSAGGCYYPRFSRLAGTLGFLSRHSWGQAFDMNTTTNAQGAIPMMNCDVVRIFRKHNFIWGGNFLLPDGMHFEWVGTRRDQFQYPSKYCPNLPIRTDATHTDAGQTDAPGSDAASTPSADVAASDTSTMLVDVDR